jgi:hypothetical protein
MAPKQQRIQVGRSEPRRSAPKGYFSNAYNTITSPENASVVRSVAIFGVRIPPALSSARYLSRASMHLALKRKIISGWEMKGGEG